MAKLLSKNDLVKHVTRRVLSQGTPIMQDDVAEVLNALDELMTEMLTATKFNGRKLKDGDYFRIGPMRLILKRREERVYNTPLTDGKPKKVGAGRRWAMRLVPSVKAAVKAAPAPRKGKKITLKRESVDADE